MKINSLKEKDEFDGYLLISKVEHKTSSANAPYLYMVLQDDTGFFDTNLWNVTKTQSEKCTSGTVMHFKGQVIKFKNALQLKITSVEEPTLYANPADFVKQGPIPKEELKNDIPMYFEKITNPQCKLIVEALYKKYEDNFYDHPAAMRNHHEFASGLATHKLEMFKIADGIIAVYPELNASLVYAGIFLHDLGKIQELSGPVATEYTFEGKMLGHISLMQSEIDTIANIHGIEHEEDVILLRHIVLSHHGQLAYGSPVLPMIPEAEIVYLIDNISARMDTMNKALEGVTPGEFSSRVFALDNRMLYKTKSGNQ